MDVASGCVVRADRLGTDVSAVAGTDRPKRCVMHGIFTAFSLILSKPFRRPLPLAKRIRENDEGTTAIEFGILAVPFFLFVFGIMAVGLQFFTINALDHAVEAASRKIRTGEAQKEGKTMNDFRQMVCDEAGTYIAVDCDDGRLIVHVQSGDDWADIAPSACASGGNLTAPAGSGTDPLSDNSGGAGQVVLVTACYDWTLPIQFPYLQYMMMLPADGIPLSSGGSLIQSASTFRTEPYE
ncbi:MAG: TadE/TadG family type IV pilus assembly protein [Hyphomicrobium sp.]|nr:TadE/TadG family type IV pilus assembly protein [Hyphomicrobium sp.]